MQVKVDHITKIFGTLRANDDISMTFDGGRIYAVLGENGAGKSTLMKILSGYQPADSGQIVIDNLPVTFDTPASALAYGIGMLHQDPLDVPSLTALENFILGRPGGLLPDQKSARSLFTEQAERLGFSLDPDAYIDTLTIGERQQLEIVRLLSLGAKLLILDEPTTGISADQKETLFNSLRRLATQEGMIIILVSHKLEDVEALCHSVYVLRHGKVTGEHSLPCSTNTLVELMFGKAPERTPRPPAERGDVILHVQQVTIPGRRLVVENITMDVRAGEVIGLAGLDGSGQQAFLQACAGLQKPSRGQIIFQGKNRSNYHHLIKQGVAYAPAGRLEEGLIARLTLADHFALTMPNGLWINWQAATARARDRIAHYNIRGAPESKIQTLSGGNQQRTLLALLPENLKLLLLESPTRGLDVESARWVWTQLLARRSSGAAIIFVSSDLDELVEYSDRIAVFFGGRVTMVDDLSTTSVAQLGQLIGGKAVS